MAQIAYGVPHFPEASAFPAANVQQEVKAGDQNICLAEVLDGTRKKQGEEFMARVRSDGVN